MANQNGRPVAPARKLVAAVVGTIAVFVMLFGLGMSSWAIVALGVAMLALAIGIGMVNVVRRGARAWVAGTAQVKAVSEPPATSIYGRAELQIVIVAPGLPTSEVTVRDPRVPVSKWPHVGDTLPVTVDVDDMRRVRINWDEAETNEAGMTVPPAYYDEDLPDDDLLGGEPEPPPWATRDRQWGRGPDEPPPPPPAPRMGDLDDAPLPVIVRDAPGGPIVEGQLVDPDYDYAGPLPHRARTATPGPSRPADSRPRPRPRPHATATLDPETADRTHTEPTEAAPPPAQAAAGFPSAPPAPEQRTPPAPDSPPDTPAQEQRTPPAPDSPPDTSAPEQRTPPAPEASADAATAAPEARSRAVTDHDPEIDLPLDGGPEQAPETTPAAREAMASGIMAPPATDSLPATDSPAMDNARAQGPSGDRAARVLDTEATRDRLARSADDDLLGDLEPPPWTIREREQAEASDRAAAPAAGQDQAPETPSTAGPVPDDRPTPGDRPTAARTQVSHSGAAPRSAEKPTSLAAAAGAVVAAGMAAFGSALRGPKYGQKAPDAQATGSVAPERAAPPRPRGPERERAAEDPAPNDHTTTIDPPPSPATATAPATAPPQAAGEPSYAAPATDAGGTSAAATGAAGAAAPGAAAAGAATRRSPWADLEGGFEPDEPADDLITAYPSARPGATSAIHGVGITVLVTNLERSMAFYRELLGFHEIDSGAGSAVLASGDTRLVLREVHDLSAMAGRLIYLNLEVGDVAAVYEELKRKGAVFVHGPRPVNRGDKLELWAASFHDPDEHNIAITQWRAVR